MRTRNRKQTRRRGFSEGPPPAGEAEEASVAGRRFDPRLGAEVNVRLGSRRPLGDRRPHRRSGLRAICKRRKGEEGASEPPSPRGFPGKSVRPASTFVQQRWRRRWHDNEPFSAGVTGEPLNDVASLIKPPAGWRVGGGCASSLCPCCFSAAP